MNQWQQQTIQLNAAASFTFACPISIIIEFTAFERIGCILRRREQLRETCNQIHNLHSVRQQFYFSCRQELYKPLRCQD